jgi:hypothetical protein
MSVGHRRNSNNDPVMAQEGMEHPLSCRFVQEVEERVFHHFIFLLKILELKYDTQKLQTHSTVIKNLLCVKNVSYLYKPDLQTLEH